MSEQQPPEQGGDGTPGQTDEAATRADEAGRPGTMSMADYREAMTDRNIHARNRGLDRPFIAGGQDPDPAAGRREERRYLRLLLAMVLGIVAGGLLLSIVAYVITGGAAG